MIQKFTVLSIEDNEADFVLIKKALKRIPGLLLDVININNGEDALNFIYRKGHYKSAPRPNIILLDINLPKLSGKEILKIVKADNNYKTIPIIIFSTSDYYLDIEETYELHANSYVTKTFDINNLYKKINIIGNYWLKSNILPDHNNFCYVQ